MPGLLGPADCGIRRETHEVDVCIVGGGLTGLCASLAAARHGARALLMHDRPVLGGNSSSEIRMHICGADRHGQLPNLRETGILEELRLENVRRNPTESYSLWDALLYEKARFQLGLDLLLNCTCQGAEMAGHRIAAITGWQMTTQIYHTIRAAIFVDCSGDAILAPLTGAEFRMGREGRTEYGESTAPEQPDAHTMGLSCMFMARRYDTPQPFEPLAWAYDFPHDEDLPYGGTEGHNWLPYGYWWIEIGGDRHSLYDSEAVRDELLKILFGVWDHVKNHGDHGAQNWTLDWIQFLPGKRESRRYIGDHVLTQPDIEAEGRFDDRVAYGGWTMDIHHPAGFWAARLGQPATIFHPCPSPYGIPYRSLYSRNVQNLMCAGRSASCTHAAMSSTRVMGTCCSMGQAVGTAAALAVRRGLTPRGLGGCMRELQQTLLRDDCYLPWVRQEFGPLTRGARLIASNGDPEPLRDGTSRPVGAESHSWPCSAGDWATYAFPTPAHVGELTLVFDSALDRLLTLNHDRPVEGELFAVPPTMARAFHLDGLIGGDWVRLYETGSNYQRLARIAIDRQVEAIRFVLDGTWGSEGTQVFAFYLD